ncbi:hypothetical protein S245_032444, partial [Arachis hypogaea]
RIEKKNVSSVELIVRYCFKIVGVTTRLLAIQRLVEIKYVSEQLNFKICTLLLHSGKVIESVAWFRQHKNAYKRLVGTLEAIFVHLDWMSSSKTAQIFPPITLGSASKPLFEWEFHPVYYYQLADHYLGQKRSSLELVISTTETSSDTNSADSVVLLTYSYRASVIDTALSPSRRRVFCGRQCRLSPLWHWLSVRLHRCRLHC